MLGDGLVAETSGGAAAAAAPAAKRKKRGYGISSFCFGLGYGDGFPDTSRARCRFGVDGVLEVYTVGGGEYLVNTFNAVAAWAGGGGYRSLLRVAPGLSGILCGRPVTVIR